MANNFYTATEALKRAYEDIEKTHSIIEIGGSEIFRIPNRTKLYSDLLGFKEPTLAERLLSYYQSQDEVFSSKADEENNKIIAAQKDADTVQYILDNLNHNISDVDFEALKLVEEELQETQNYLSNPVDKIEIDIPGLGGSFIIDNDSHKQKTLEPKDNEGN